MSIIAHAKFVTTYISNLSCIIHIKVMPNSQFTTYNSPLIMYIPPYHIYYHINIHSNICTTLKIREGTKQTRILAQSSLRLKSLAQVSSLRLGEGSKIGNNGLCILSLRRAFLAWARWTLAQNRGMSPRRQFT